MTQEESWLAKYNEVVLLRLITGIPRGIGLRSMIC